MLLRWFLKTLTISLVSVGVGIPAGAQLARVRIEGIDPFQHSSQVFQLSVPSNWTQADLSGGGILRYSFTDPLENALMVVAIVNNPQIADTQTALTAILKNDVEEAFGKEKNFKMDPPVLMRDGSINLPFSYYVNINDRDEPMMGNCYIQKFDDYVTFLYVLLPLEQYAFLKPDLLVLINSLTINPQAAFPKI